MVLKNFKILSFFLMLLLSITFASATLMQSQNTSGVNLFTMENAGESVCGQLLPTVTFQVQNISFWYTTKTGSGAQISASIWTGNATEPLTRVFTFNSSNIPLANAWHAVGTATPVYTVNPGTFYWVCQWVTITSAGNSNLLRAAAVPEFNISVSATNNSAFSNHLDTHSITHQVHGIPSTPNINASLTLPTDNDHLNDEPVNFTFNMNSTGGFTNASLYINGTLNKTILNLPDGDNWINTSLAEGVWTWFVFFESGSNNLTSATRTVFQDGTAPLWTVNPSNFFAADNSTIIHPLTSGSVKALNLTLEDTYLFAYNVTINASNATAMFTIQATGLLTSIENITNNVDMTGWRSGTFTATLYAEDDHTAKTITDYEHRAVTDGREWTLSDDTIVRVTSVGSTISTIKEGDRYTFTADFSSPRNTINLFLTSTKPLFYRENLYSFPSFVTGKHWVDFHTEAASYVVTDQGYEEGWYKYKVRVYTSSKDSFTFKSLGGLNTVTNKYTFLLNNTPRQAENLSAGNITSTAIFLNWSVFPETNWTELYRDGVNIVNLTNITNFHNDTGLASGTSFNYVIYAVSFDGSRNLSVSAENNITVSTLSNNSVNFFIRNEVNEQLINTTIIFVNLINNDLNLSGNTTTGTLTFSNISTNNYTIRHTALDWGLRDQFLALLGNTNQNITLFLLNNSFRSTAVIDVTDTRTNPVIGAKVSLLRYYGSCNCYQTVEEAETLNDGTAAFSVQLYDAFYRWVVEFNGVTLYVSPTPGALVPESDGIARKTFTIDVGNDFYKSYINNVDIARAVTFNESSDTLSFFWNDPSGIVTRGCLQANFVNGSVWQSAGTSCLSANTGIVLLTLTDANTTKYHWNTQLTTSTTFSTIADAGVIEFASVFPFGVLGVFMQAALLIGGAIIFSSSAIIVMLWISLNLVASLFLSFLGFSIIPLGYTAVVSLITLFVGVFAIFMMRR